MKHLFLTAIFISLLLLAENLYCNTQRIFYNGGIQTGTFKIAGDALPANYIDTVIIDSNLLITNFRATLMPDPMYCMTTRIYTGFFIQSQNGSMGKSAGADTSWTSATTFPNSLSLLDTITQSGYSMSKAFGNSPRGLKIDTITVGGYCEDARYYFFQNYDHLIYFQLHSNSGDRYGKMKIYGVEYVPDYIDGEYHISNYDVVYTISNTQNLNSGPIGIYPFKENARASSFQNQTFDLLGRHVPNSFSSDRNLISIPVLFSKP